MTTLAYNHADKEFACDSQPTSGNIRGADMDKWVNLQDGKVFITGDVAKALRLISQMSNGEELDPALFEDVTLIVVSKGKVIEYLGPIGLNVKRNWAWGSGRELALGAMAAGATAASAVNIAKKYDINTGGKVHSFSTKG